MLKLKYFGVTAAASHYGFWKYVERNGQLIVIYLLNVLSDYPWCPPEKIEASYHDRAHTVSQQPAHDKCDEDVDWADGLPQHLRHQHAGGGRQGPDTQTE